MQFIISFWKGDVKLWKTIWIFGVVVPILLYTTINSLLFKFIIPNQNPYFLFLFSSILFAYLLFSWVAIWRSSNKYNGIRIWSYLAKGLILLSIIVSIYFGYTFYFISKIIATDSGKDSSNISRYLNHDNNYPFVGFWKIDCDEDYGFAINETADGLYSVSFCGPGGCFKPGTYRPNTSLIDDPEYRIISKDVIEIKGGDGYSRYIKCNSIKKWK